MPIRRPSTDRRSAPERRASHRRPYRRIERVVDLFEGAPPWLIAEHPEADQPQHVPEAKYRKAGPSMTRFGAAGLMKSPAPMINASPSGPTNLPRLPTP